MFAVGGRGGVSYVLPCSSFYGLVHEEWEAWGRGGGKVRAQRRERKQKISVVGLSVLSLQLRNVPRLLPYVQNMCARQHEAAHMLVRSCDVLVHG